MRKFAGGRAAPRADRNLHETEIEGLFDRAREMGKTFAAVVAMVGEKSRTARSYRARHQQACLGANSRVARQSLLALLMSLSCVGCLVADPPLADAPGKSPPFLLLNQANPPITQIVQLDDRFKEKSYVDFSVPVRSEDRDDKLQVNVHIDYRFDTSRHTLVIAGSLEAGSLDDPPRDIRFELSSNQNDFGTDRRGPGCHQVTLIVCHSSNVTDNLSGECDPQKALQDTAMATWWINYDPPDGNPSNLANCPVLNAAQQ